MSMHEGKNGTTGLAESPLIARPLHGLTHRSGRQLRDHARRLGGRKRCAVCEDAGIHYQQLTRRSRLATEHDPAEAHLRIDLKDELGKLRLAHSLIESRA